jgi:hypothetical protein
MPSNANTTEPKNNGIVPKSAMSGYLEIGGRSCTQYTRIMTRLVIVSMLANMANGASDLRFLMNVYGTRKKRSMAM